MNKNENFQPELFSEYEYSVNRKCESIESVKLPRIIDLTKAIENKRKNEESALYKEIVDSVRHIM